MKVIFVTYCRAMFGANLCMMTLIKDLKDRYGVEPLVIVPEMHDGELEEILIKENIPYIVSYAKAWIVPQGQKLRLLRGIKYSFLSHKNAKEIANQLKSEQFDLVYSNNSTIQFGADLAREMKLPHVWQVREYAKVHYNVDFCYSDYCVNRKFREANRVITVSKDLEKYVKEQLSKKAKTEVVYDGVDDVTVEKTDFEKDDGICQFVYVGVLQEGKNQLELIKAAELLVMEDITKFHINLVGTGDEYGKVLNEYVREHKLGDYVSFCGYESKIMETLSKMDVGVICSKSEAFGRVTVEYMLASLPVIGAAGGGTSEIVEDGKTGILYTSGNIFELKYSMEKMINNTEKRIIMGAEGKTRAVNLFSTERNTDYIYSIFETANK